MASSSTVPANPATSTRPGRARRILRILWRVSRTGLVLCLLLLLIAIIYLNQVGLPETVKQRLTAGLREKGWEVQYAKLRLSVRRPGVIAENLYLHRTNLWSGPQIYAQEARCRVRGNALKKLEVQFESARLTGARLLWPLTKTNQLESTLLVNNIAGDIYFGRDDVWELRNLRGTSLGLQLNVSGVISNGSFLRDWKMPKPTRPAGPGTYSRWSRILAAAGKVRFLGAPELGAQFSGDASKLDSFGGSVLLHVPSFESPWANGTNLILSAYSQPGGAIERYQRLELDCVLERVITPWIKGEGLHLNSGVTHTLAPWTLPTNLALRIQAQQLETPTAKAVNITGTSLIHLPATNTEPRHSDWNLKAAALDTEWGTARQAGIDVSVEHGSTNWLPRFISNAVQVVAYKSKWAAADSVELTAAGELSGLTNFLRLDATAKVGGIAAKDVRGEELRIRAAWSAPELRLQIDGEVADGYLHAGSALNTQTGELSFRGNSGLDPRRISSLLTTNTRRFLANYHWDKPPLIQAQGSLRVPLPLREEINWEREVMPTVAAQGEFQIGKCAYRSVPFDSARAPFTFSNSVFRMPELVVTRPEGSARGAYSSKPLLKEFHWKLQSNIDPKILRPLFAETNVMRAFDMVEFSTPPKISAEIAGHWRDLDRLSGFAEVAATNFAVRGQQVTFGKTFVAYTNQVLEFLNPFVMRQQETGTAARIAIDIGQKKILFTNVHGNLNPYIVTAAIGKSASQAIAPYEFAIPPDVKLNGVLDIKRGGWEDDMHFSVNGGPMFWKPFHAQKVGGQIHWAGRTVFLSDMFANLHNGQAKGDAKFDFGKKGAQFSFKTQWSDIDLRSLMTDFSPKTNRLEGTLRGELQITSANTADIKSWNGRGLMELKDGLIWDIPVFGIFSPIMNGFMPGAGNSRAREASASYIITNSVIHTVDLQIHASAMRMQFDGTIDFDKNLKGRMEAEILRDVPAIGLVISKLLWPVTKIFEYRITGTLQEPKTEPVYIIPKIILFPFSPIKTIKDIFSPEPEQK
jgi:hypothetical protein